VTQDHKPEKISKFHLRWTLKIKLITFTTLMIFFIMAVMGAFVIIREKRLLIEKVRSESTTLVKSLSIPLTNVFLNQEVGIAEEEELLETYILQIMEENWPIKYSIILDNSNRVLVHNDLKEYGKQYDDPRTRRASESWSTLTQEYIHPIHGAVLEASIPLAISSKRWGTLRVGFSLLPIYSRIKLLYWEIIGATLGLLALAFVIVNYSSRKLISPLSMLTNEMKKTSVDQPHQKMAISSSDEIGYLTKTFEDMRERLFYSHQRLKQAQNHVVRAEKLASIGRLASGIAHEINNPLNGIQNCIRMILTEPDNKNQTSRYLSLTNEGLAKIESVVKKLLNYARQDKLIRKEVNINNSLRKMVDLLAYKNSKNSIEIIIKPDESLPLITGDPHLIEQVFLNILINAFDAMPDGGEIRIKTEHKTTSGQDGVFCTISDTGAGIEESEITKIFDPFYTTKDVGEGTGLGLSVCLGIVERHHGELSVTSKPGEGATFTVFFPEHISSP